MISKTRPARGCLGQTEELLTDRPGSPASVPTPDGYVEFPEDHTTPSFVEHFEQRVRLHAELRAVKSDQVDLNYGDLNRAANRVAHSILSRYPAPLTQPLTTGPESREDATDPVAVLVGPGVAAVVAAIGVLKTGKAYVPLDPADSRLRIGHILQDLPANVVITDGKYLTLARELAPAGCTVFNIDAIDERVSDTNPALVIPPETLAYVAFTSGSTGHPKGVMHTHRSLYHDTVSKSGLHRICRHDRCSLIGLGTGQALKNMTLPLLNGASLYPHDVRQEGVGQLADWLMQNQITILIVVAPLFRSLLDALTGNEQFAHLRLIRLASDRVYPDDVERFKEHFAPHCVLLNMLSSTETGTICSYVIDKSTRIEGATVPVGYPPEGTEVLLLDETSDAGSETGPGVIAVRSRSLSCGYWRQPGLTQAAFRTNRKDPGALLYRSADLGRRRPDGALEHIGRCDFQVKIRGYLVDTAEVEALLRAHAQVRDAAVHAPSDPGGHRSLIGYVVPASNPPVQVEELRRFLSDRLANHMVPSSFVFLDSLPLLASGKIDRSALPEPYQMQLIAPGADVSPVAAVEDALAGIWAEVLGREVVGKDDDFFDLGGHSLLAFQLFARIEKRFRKRLPVALLYQHGTVAGIARHLTGATEAGHKITVIELQQGRTGRRRLFAMPTVGAELMAVAKLIRHLGADVPVYGLQPDLSDEAVPQSLDFNATAAIYVRALRSFQPSGPYALIGYSFGALLAYEVARQITELGDVVDHVFLLDKGPRRGGPGPSPAQLLVRVLRILQNLPRWLRDDAPYSPRDCYWRARQLFRRLAPNWLLRLFGKKLSPGSAQTTTLSRIPTQNPALVAILKDASRKYVPQDYSGAVTLFRARTRPFFSDVADDLGWGRLARGGVQIHHIPGHHSSILDEPHVRILARELRESIARLEL